MSEEKVKAKKVHDVVYIMDDRSKRANIELMFSLRSVKQHLKNYRKIHIFGADMSQLIKSTATVKHHIIPPTEGPNHLVKKHKLINIICQDDSVSEDFILISDDCFLLEDHDANKLPFYYSGTLTDRFEGYRNQNSVSLLNLRDTIKILKENNRKDKYYNTHTPLMLNKKKFLDLGKDFYLEEFEKGLLYKSLYCNYYKKRGKTTILRLIYWKCSEEVLEARLTKAPYFAVNDSGLTLVVIKFLQNTFPKKLSWEK
jgi:hypothetical protein